MALTHKQKVIVCASVALFSVVMLLRGCSRDPQPTVMLQPQAQQQVQVEREYVQQEPNVVVVQQSPQTVYHDSGINAGHLAAGALGYMAGRNSNSNSYGSNNRPVINKNYYSKKVYVSKPSKSYFGSSSTKRYKRR